MGKIIYLTYEWVESKLISIYDSRMIERRKFRHDLPKSIDKKHERQNKYIDALERWKAQYKKLNKK